MTALRVSLLVLSVATTACVSTTTESRFVSDGERPVLVAPAADKPTLDVRLAYEAGIVKGRVTWSQRCRTGIESLSHEEVNEVKKPNIGGGVAAMLIGGIVGVASGAILSNANTLSDDQSCNYDAEGHYHCSSPRQDATVIGVTGILVGAGLAVGGLGTFGMKPTSKPLEPIAHPPVLTKVTDKEVACGEGRVVGLGLALLRAGERVAATSTNAEGDFALVIPARTTGPMSLVVDSVPWSTRTTRAHELLAQIEIPALAEPASEPTMPSAVPTP